MPKSSMVQGATSYITIEDNVLDSVGNYAAVYGDVIQVGAGTQHILIQRNTITHGGHDLVEFDSDYGVLQSNTLNNSFADMVGGDTGYRSIEVQGSFNVIQGNFMEHARPAVGGSGTAISFSPRQLRISYDIISFSTASLTATRHLVAATPDPGDERPYLQQHHISIGAAAIGRLGIHRVRRPGEPGVRQQSGGAIAYEPGPAEGWSNGGTVSDVTFFSRVGGAGLANVGQGPTGHRAS